MQKQKVNFVWGIIAVFFSDPHKTHKNTVWAESRILVIKPGDKL